MPLAAAPRATDLAPELTMVYARVPGRAPADLPGPVARILALLDGARRTDAVLEAAQISADKGLAVVRKLSRLGIIATASTPPATGKTRAPMSDGALERAETLRGLAPIPARPAAFSAAEEAFFASEVAEGEEEEPSGLGHRLSLLISDLVLYLRRDVAL